MSPQMNGEERDAASGQDPRPVSAMEDAPQPLPPAVDTSRVTRTTATAPAELPPLFGPEALTDLRKRWDSVQRGFVDDPKEAVHAADAMVVEITKGLAARFAEQRTSLEGKFQRSEGPSTENLRLALQQYRSFFERLLSL